MSLRLRLTDGTDVVTEEALSPTDVLTTAGILTVTTPQGDKVWTTAAHVVYIEQPTVVP